MNNRPRSQSKDVETDVRKPLKALMRRLPYLIVFAGFVAVLTYFGLDRIAPRYLSQATILVEAGESDRAPAPNGPQPRTAAPDEGAVASQVQLLHSRDLARRVAERLDLGTRAEFNPALEEGSLVLDLLAAMGLGRDPLKTSVEERVLERFAGKLSAYAIERSPVIAVEFSSADPELAADAANAVAEEYIALQRAARRDTVGDRPAGASIASRALVPTEPSFPKKVPAGAAAGMAALLLGIVFVLIRERARGRRARTVAFAPVPAMPETVPVAAARPWADDHGVRRMMPAGPEPRPARANERSEESLAAAAREAIAGGYKRIMVTIAEGTDSGGRPLAAVALARALARAELRPVLIDLCGDGANSVSMGEEGRLPGFADLFAGEASFAQVIFRDRKSRVHFIPGGIRPLAPEEFADERVGPLLSALDHTYDHVILDVADDVIDRVGPGCEAAVVVTEFGATDPRTIHAFKRVASVCDARIILLTVDPVPLGEDGAAEAVREKGEAA